MFCEKCGAPIPDGASFCEKCGAPVASQPAQPAYDQPGPLPEQPMNNQPQQPAPAQPMNSQPAPAPAQPYQPNQPQQPAAPKKPLDPKTKKIIMLSSIGGGALLVVLILLFTVIIPAIQKANEIDISQYYIIRFEGVQEEQKEKSVMDGKIDGRFVWDTEKFAADRKMPVDKAKSLLYNIQSYIDLGYYANGEETYSNSFDDKSENDTFKVTFTWPKEGGNAYERFLSNLPAIERYEREAGVKFKHEDNAREYKLADVLKEQNITVKKPLSVSLLTYIKDNNLIVEDGEVSGRASVSVKAFETTFGDYTFRLPSDSTHVDVIDKNSNKIGSIGLDISQRHYLRNGDIITIEYSYGAKSSMEEKGIILEGDSISYTVTAPEPTTVAPTTLAPVTMAPSTAPSTAPETTAPATTVEPTVPTTVPSSSFDRAYVRHAREYDMYYLFDTKNKKVVYFSTYFSTNDTSEMEGKFSGDFNKEVDIHWTKPEDFHEGFIHKDGAKKASLIDKSGNGATWDFEVCDVATAVQARNNHK